jgi:uridine kinase
VTGRSHAVRESAASTKLILVRGNSGSGKSTIAAGIRAVYGRGIAIVGQDNLRREVLRERDRAGAANATKPNA